MAREVVNHLNAVRSILQTLHEPQLSQMSEKQSKQIDAKIRTLNGQLSPSDLAEICVAIGSVGFNSADTSRLQLAVSESTAEPRGTDPKYQNFENIVAYLPEWLWQNMVTETGYTDLVEFLVDLGLVNGSEGTFQIATILLLLSSEGPARALQHTGQAKNTLMKSVKRWFGTTLKTKSTVAKPPLLMYLPRDPRDFQSGNPERYAQCYSKGEPIPCKFDFVSIELMKDGNWMRIGKSSGKAAAAKNGNISLPLADDGSASIMNALQSLMYQQNMFMQSFMLGQSPQSFSAPRGPRIEILGDQQRSGAMIGLPQGAPALQRLQTWQLPDNAPQGWLHGVQPPSPPTPPPGRASMLQPGGGATASQPSAGQMQQPSAATSSSQEHMFSPGPPAAPGLFETPPSKNAEEAEHEHSPPHAKPALFHQVPDAPAAPQTTQPPVHASVGQATEAALAAFHARAATKEVQKKKEREEKAAEKAAKKERERDAKAKEKERMRLKDVAAKEKVRLQFEAMKGSKAAGAGSKTPSDKPPSKAKTETTKTPSGKPPSKEKAESKEKAAPKKKTPQTKSDDVTKIKLENERTRHHFLIRTGVKRRGEGSVQFSYDPKVPGSEKAAKTTALNYLSAFCKYNGTPFPPPRGITS